MASSSPGFTPLFAGVEGQGGATRSATPSPAPSRATSPPCRPSSPGFTPLRAGVEGRGGASRPATPAPP
eukprot:13174589-Alexandrium_andersonii.AAC.1